MKTVVIKLNFGQGSEKLQADIADTQGVPYSMIVESLNNLTKGIAQQLVIEAKEQGVPDNDIPAYLDARLKVDRKTISEL